MKTRLSKSEILLIKLKDLEKLTDEECCSKMDISINELEQLMLSTREKIANSILNNKRITYDKSKLKIREDIIKEDEKICFFRCGICGVLYSVDYETDSIKCPLCDSKTIMNIK